MSAAGIITAATGISKTRRRRWYNHLQRSGELFMASFIGFALWILYLNPSDLEPIIAAAIVAGLYLTMNGLLRWARYIDGIKR